VLKITLNDIIVTLPSNIISLFREYQYYFNFSKKGYRAFLVERKIYWGIEVQNVLKKNILTSCMKEIVIFIKLKNPVTSKIIYGGSRLLCLISNRSFKKVEGGKGWILFKKYVKPEL
jgi:hypothetical protein